MGGSRPRRRLGRLKGTQRETLLKKESHAAELVIICIYEELVTQEFAPPQELPISSTRVHVIFKMKDAFAHTPIAHNALFLR